MFFKKKPKDAEVRPTTGGHTIGITPGSLHIVDPTTIYPYISSTNFDDIYNTSNTIHSLLKQKNDPLVKELLVKLFDAMHEAKKESQLKEEEKEWLR